MPRDLAIEYHRVEREGLLDDWDWLVPSDHTPLMVGAFGDWIFGAPDGSIWWLDLLKGEYQRVARNSDEFSRLKKNPKKLDLWFSAGWVTIAAEHGLIPKIDECLGWKTPPVLGAKFSVENIGIFSLMVYVSLQGQLHRQLRGLGLE
jgi:hypothetical protein